MFKKCIGIFLIASILMVPMVNECDAGSNVFQNAGHMSDYSTLSRLSMEVKQDIPVGAKEYAGHYYYIYENIKFFYKIH